MGYVFIMVGNDHMSAKRDIELKLMFSTNETFAIFCDIFINNNKLRTAKISDNRIHVSSKPPRVSDPFWRVRWGKHADLPFSEMGSA